MINLLYFFLPAIFLLGVLASFWDIKHGKVKNWFIALAVIYPILAYSALILYLKFTQSPINSGYILELFTNFLAAFLLSFMLYSSRFWAPGDGKLFFAFSLLIPLSVYSNFYVKFFPSLIFFSNTFILSSFYLLLRSLISLREKKLKEIKKIFGLKIFLQKILLLILSIFSFSWIIHKILKNLFLIPSFYLTLLSYSCAMIINMILSKFIKKKYLLYLSYLLLSLFNMIFLKAYTSLLNIISFSLIFSLFKMFVIDAQEKINLSRARIGGLLPYSQIMEPLFYKGKEICRAGEVLSKDKTKNIKEIFKGSKKVLMKENAPLAPFLFLGALVTILVKGEIITWLLALLR